MGYYHSLLLRCVYHGSGQVNELAVALAGGSCLASVAKMPGTHVEAHLVRSAFKVCGGWVLKRL